MAKRLTLREFICKAIELHGNIYDYSQVEYVNNRSPVNIICSMHGVFKQSAGAHLENRGCPKCGIATRVAGRTDSFEDFKSKAVVVHKGKFSYPMASNFGKNSKINIVCPVHGVFSQTPASHLSGKGCRGCSDDINSQRCRHDTEKFIEKAKKVHGDKYGYDFVEYRRKIDKVSITCDTHGNFTQEAGSHLCGKGCPHCGSGGGYRNDRPGNFYILRSGDITKIGITNRTVKARAKEVSESYKQPFETLLYIAFTNGSVARDIETALLRELPKTYKQPARIFDGSTECFLDVDYDSLLLETTKLCAKFLSPK